MISRRAFVAGALTAPAAFALTDSVAPSLLDNGSGPLVRRGVRFTGPVWIDGTRTGVVFEDCAFDSYCRLGEGDGRIREVEFRRCSFRSQPWPSMSQPISGLQFFGDVAGVRVTDCVSVGNSGNYGVIVYARRVEPTDVVIEGGSLSGARAGVYACRVGSLTVRGVRFHDVPSTDSVSLPVGAVAVNRARDLVVTDCSLRDCAHGISAYLYRDGHGWIAGNDMLGTQLAYSLWGEGQQWLVERESIPDRWAFTDGRWSTA